MEFKRREQLLALIAAICIGAFAADRLVITPLVSLWKQRSRRIAELEQSLNKGRSLLDRADVLKKRWAEMKSKSLPTDLSAAEEQVLQAMSRWTRASGLGVSSLKPRWIEEEGAIQKKIDCRVTAEGDLPAVVRFLYEMESDPLALRLEEAEITSRDDDGRKLTLGLRFTGLVLLDEKP